RRWPFPSVVARILRPPKSRLSPRAPGAGAPRAAKPPHRRAAECSQQFPPSDGDGHTPLPCEVRKGNDTTPRACCPSIATPARAERDDENARPTVVAASVPATARPRYADRRAAAP